MRSIAAQHDLQELREKVYQRRLNTYHQLIKSITFDLVQNGLWNYLNEIIDAQQQEELINEPNVDNQPLDIEDTPQIISEEPQQEDPVKVAKNDNQSSDNGGDSETIIDEQQQNELNSEQEAKSMPEWWPKYTAKIMKWHVLYKKIKPLKERGMNNTQIAHELEIRRQDITHIIIWGKEIQRRSN